MKDDLINNLCEWDFLELDIKDFAHFVKTILNSTNDKKKYDIIFQNNN